MAFKTLIIVCASALFVQCAFGQTLAGLGAPLASWNGINAGLNGLGGCGCGGVASTGGGLPVASASPCAPVGVSVLSENAYEGRLCAGGNLPFLGTVAIEGVLPTAGAGAVSYGCGNGAIGIGAEGPIATGILSPGDFAPGVGLAANGIGVYGLGGIGYGINGIDGYGLNGFDGYGIGGIGYGPGVGCGCGAIY